MWKGRPGQLKAIGLALVVWLALYGFFLGGTSLASREEVLRPGEREAFCGVYIDCHFGVEVVGSRRAAVLGPADAQVRPGGVFVIATVHASSNVRANLTLDEPVIVLKDEAGHEWNRSQAGEAALAAEGGDLRPFNVPPSARRLRLEVAPGSSFDRLSELFLIGDEDSLLHDPTTLQLPTS